MCLICVERIWQIAHLNKYAVCLIKCVHLMEYSQNGDRLKRRQAKTAKRKRQQTKTATCLLEVNQNGDKRKWRHSLNKYVVPFRGCFPYTCGSLFVKCLRTDSFMLDIVVLFSCSCAIEV